MKPSIIRLFFGMLLITFTLSGCFTLTSHLFAVRKQICEFDKYFSLRMDQGVEVKLHEPVLLENEVILMVGEASTNRSITSNGMTARYIFRQVQTTEETKVDFNDEEFVINLLFISSDKGYVLSEIQSSEIPTEFVKIAQNVITNSSDIAQEACEVPFNPLNRSMVIDIDRDMLNLLPERQSVVSWLGPPSESTKETDDLIYEFRLRGESNNLAVARIEANYGQTSDLPIAINASFSHYQASIDVPAGTMQVKLHF